VLWRAARRNEGTLVVVVITALALRALAPEADTAQALFNLV
jgi:hypothetical protein